MVCWVSSKLDACIEFFIYTHKHTWIPRCKQSENCSCAYVHTDPNTPLHGLVEKPICTQIPRCTVCRNGGKCWHNYGRIMVDHLSIASLPHPDLTVSTLENGGKIVPKHPKIGPNRGKNTTKLSHSEPILSHNSPRCSQVILQPNLTSLRIYSIIST